MLQFNRAWTFYPYWLTDKTAKPIANWKRKTLNRGFLFLAPRRHRNRQHQPHRLRTQIRQLLLPKHLQHLLSVRDNLEKILISIRERPFIKELSIY